jgi:hypothetical protein
LPLAKRMPSLRSSNHSTIQFSDQPVESPFGPD